MPWKRRTARSRAEPYADRLRGAVPGAGHLVHMPSHIYYRVGRYLDALADNTTAAAVDEKYLAASDAPMGVYRLGYYPHNVHFVMASALMAGDGANSIAAADKLHGLVPDAAALAIPGAQPVKAAPYYAHALFSSPDAILALPDPGNSIPYVKAMWHYARGVAYAARRDFAAAKAEANAIDTIERTADFSLLKTAGIPALEVLQLARTVVEGRLAQAEGDSNKAIERFEQAAALQDALPYTEPPYWYYPVRQSLAAALMQAGRLGDAEEQFRRALARAPEQRLVVLRIARTLEGAWRRRGGAKGGSRAGEDLGRRSPAIADIKALTGVSSSGRARNKPSAPPRRARRSPVMDRDRRHLITGMAIDESEKRRQQLTFVLGGRCRTLAVTTSEAPRLSWTEPR